MKFQLFTPLVNWSIITPDLWLCVSGLVISNATHILYKPYNKMIPSIQAEAPAPPTVIFSQVIKFVNVT